MDNSKQCLTELKVVQTLNGKIIYERSEVKILMAEDEIMGGALCPAESQNNDGYYSS